MVKLIVTYRGIIEGWVTLTGISMDRAHAMCFNTEQEARDYGKDWTSDEPEHCAVHIVLA